MSDSEWTVAKPGDKVATSGDLPIGTVKSVRNDHIEVGHARLWLPDTAVVGRDDKVVRLGRDYDFLVESGAAEKSGDGVRKLLGLLSLGGAIAAAIFAFQKRRNPSRDRLSSISTQAQSSPGHLQPFNNGSTGATTLASTFPMERPLQATTAAALSIETPAAASSPESLPVQSEKSDPNRSLTTPEALEESSAGLELPPFAALDLSDRVVSETEQEVVALVSRAFPERTLQVNAIGVHTLEGGEVATLRFTVDDAASSDLLLNRLEAPQEAAASLALELIEELQVQLPLHS